MNAQPDSSKPPLILPDTAFQKEIYEPVSSLVNYINAFISEGYDAGMLPDEFIELYALDYYDAQVRNGGHGQFIYNSRERIAENIARATRAAFMIGLPKLADLLQRCASLCQIGSQTTPKEVDFLIERSELEDLDQALYNLTFTQTERDAYLASLPDGVRADLRTKYFLTGLQDALQAAGQKAARLLATQTAKGAAWDGVQEARSLFEQKLNRSYGAEPSDSKNRAVENDMRRIAKKIERVIEDLPAETRAVEVTSMIKAHLEDPGLYDLSRYHIHSAAWIATYPDLKLVPPQHFRESVASIAADNPIARANKVSRTVKQLAGELPDDTTFAVTRAIAGICRHDGKEPFLDSARMSHPKMQVYSVQTDSGRILLGVRADGTSVYLHRMRESLSYKPKVKALMLAEKLGLISTKQNLSVFFALSRCRAGRRLACEPITKGVNQLFRSLHVPEALMLWTDDPKRHFKFARGILTELDMETRRVNWRYFDDGNLIVMEADPGGVGFTDQGNGKNVHYSNSQLQLVTRGENSSPNESILSN